MSTKKQEIREKFREVVFSRDKHKCKFCGSKNNLDAHHITNRNDMPNGGYVVKNGITVCDIHHLIVKEEINNENIKKLLYALIDSTYEEAYKDSLRLKG